MRWSLQQQRRVSWSVEQSDVDEAEEEGETALGNPDHSKSSSAHSL